MNPSILVREDNQAIVKFYVQNASLPKHSLHGILPFDLFTCLSMLYSVLLILFFYSPLRGQGRVLRFA